MSNNSTSPNKQSRVCPHGQTLKENEWCGQCVPTEINTDFPSSLPPSGEWENKLIEVMENKIESIIGEDGLTVWDFAELRDAIKGFISQQLIKAREELLEEIERGVEIAILGTNPKDMLIAIVKYLDSFKKGKNK